MEQRPWTSVSTCSRIINSIIICLFLNVSKVHSRIGIAPVDRRCHGPQPPQKGKEPQPQSSTKTCFSTFSRHPHYPMSHYISSVSSLVLLSIIIGRHKGVMVTVPV
jgi:hypothetical protein